MKEYRPVLYHRPLSLACLRVRSALRKVGVPVELRDVGDRVNREALVELTDGALIVPTLVLKSTVIADTDEILKFLRLRYGER